jgi:hypothetical protein
VTDAVTGQSICDHPGPGQSERGLQEPFCLAWQEYEGKHEPFFTADEWTKLQASFGRRTAQRKLNIARPFLGCVGQVKGARPAASGYETRAPGCYGGA